MVQKRTIRCAVPGTLLDPASVVGEGRRCLRCVAHRSPKLSLKSALPSAGSCTPRLQKRRTYMSEARGSSSLHGVELTTAVNLASRTDAHPAVRRDPPAYARRGRASWGE